jgi:hypothetical protein
VNKLYLYNHGDLIFDYSGEYVCDVTLMCIHTGQAETFA